MIAPAPSVRPADEALQQTLDGEAVVRCLEHALRHVLDASEGESNNTVTNMISRFRVQLMRQIGASQDRKRKWSFSRRCTTVAELDAMDQTIRTAVAEVMQCEHMRKMLQDAKEQIASAVLEQWENLRQACLSGASEYLPPEEDNEDGGDEDEDEDEDILLSLAPAPTDALPGSWEKIEAMAHRRANNNYLWHPKDRSMAEENDEDVPIQRQREIESRRISAQYNSATQPA